MKYVLLLLTFLITGAMPQQAQTLISDSTRLSKEQVLAHVDELKKLIDDKIWPTYNDPAYSMEMNYYEDGPFRMHLDQAEDDTLARMECSSPEITIQAVPSVKTYEEWYAMLMHECFHGFQYKHTVFWNKMLASTPENFITSDSLKALRRNYEWYRDMLSKENALLKKAYEASDIHEACHILSGFYSIRDKRLKTVKDRLGLDIIEFYPIIETVEGSARYIEYRLAREQGITDTDWMTNLDSNSCYYASGLYLMLIMDKFGIPYKEELFLKYNTLTELILNRTRQEVKILIEIRPEVNYVTHLYTLAELGFSDSTYAAKYGNTLPWTAIDTLQKYKEYLTPICDTLENEDYLVPALIYKIQVSKSPKFQRLLPLLEQVPGRSGIRVHRGTKPEHSKGCILVSPYMEQQITSRWLAEQSAHEETRLEIV